MKATRVRLRLTFSAIILGSCWFFVCNALANQSGEKLYQRCSACHSFGYSRTGPDHCGLIGRLAGTLVDFEYTAAMRSSKIVWTVDNLDRFLAAPLEVVPGTSMGFIGIADPIERRLLLRYMQIQESSIDCN